MIVFMLFLLGTAIIAGKTRKNEIQHIFIRAKSPLERMRFNTNVKYYEIIVLHDFSILNAILVFFNIKMGAFTLERIS